jgi:hypothetical protein
MDLKERILIEIDPETQTYSADYGCGSPINLARAHGVLKAMLSELESGALLEDPNMNVGTEEEVLDTD